MIIEEFKETIEYKDQMKMYKVYFDIWLLSILYISIDIGMFISLFNLDKDAANIISVSIITIFLIALFSFLSRAIGVKEKISEIYNKISNMYVFEFTFGELN